MVVSLFISNSDDYEKGSKKDFDILGRTDCVILGNRLAIWNCLI